MGVMRFNNFPTFSNLIPETSYMNYLLNYESEIYIYIYIKEFIN